MLEKKIRKIFYNLCVGNAFSSKVGYPEMRYKFQRPKQNKTKKSLSL